MVASFNGITCGCREPCKAGEHPGRVFGGLWRRAARIGGDSGVRRERRSPRDGHRQDSIKTCHDTGDIRGCGPLLANIAAISRIGRLRAEVQAISAGQGDIAWLSLFQVK